MHNFSITLKQSCLLYQKLYEATVTAVEFANQGKFDAVTDHVVKSSEILKEIEVLDLEIDRHADEQHIAANRALWDERQKLIQQSLDFHTSILPSLRSKLAVHSAEIRQVRNGIRGMSGYRSGADQTGQRIKGSH